MAALFPESVVEPNLSGMAHTLSRMLETTLHEQIAAGAQTLRRAA